MVEIGSADRVTPHAYGTFVLFDRKNVRPAEQVSATPAIIHTNNRIPARLRRIALSLTQIKAYVCRDGRPN